MSSVRWMDKLKRFWRLSGADKWLLLRAVGWMLAARIMLIASSFRRLSAPMPAAKDATQPEPDPELLQRIGWAVAVAANHVPWRSDCFPQTIAARMLLKRYGFTSTIHIGVERVGEDELNAHAWLTCGNTVITGGTDLDRYTELHTPVAAASSRDKGAPPIP